jgi:8-oxo-dGTP diphosphatase
MPDAGAAAVIFDDQGRVLLIKENYDRRRWGFPGGRAERGEAPQDTAVRETREETGLDVEVDHLVGLYRLDTGFWVHVFRCHVTGGAAAVPPTGEIAEVGWFPPEEIPSPVTNALHHGLPDAVAGARGVVRDGLPRVT